MKMKDETMTSSFQFMQTDYDNMKQQNKVNINSCFCVSVIIMHYIYVYILMSVLRHKYRTSCRYTALVSCLYNNYGVIQGYAYYVH